MAGVALDEELISLHYYARQQCSRQWVHFMAAMFAEFEERVDPAEADQFLETLGFKMALLLPLRRCDTLEELEDDINSVLEGIDWGWMRIGEKDRTMNAAMIVDAPIMVGSTSRPTMRPAVSRSRAALSR